MRDLRVSMTRDGQAVGVFVAALLGVSWRTGDNLLYLVASVLLAGVLVAGIVGALNVVDLGVLRELPEELFATRPARVTYRLTRRLPWPAWQVRLHEEVVQVRGPLVHEIASGAPHLHATQWVAPERGRLDLERVWLASSFPFGLLTWRRPVAAGDTAWVWPFPEVSDPPSSAAGEGDALNTWVPEEVDDIRPYREGDRMRDLHWATSARAGAPMVVVRRGMLEEPVWILVPACTGEAREQALRRATGGVIDAIARRRAVGLRLDGAVWPPRAGGAWRRELLDALAAAPGRSG